MRGQGMKHMAWLAAGAALALSSAPAMAQQATRSISAGDKAQGAQAKRPDGRAGDRGLQKRGTSIPPSTGKECPVENGMAPAASVATAPPISSASPQRRISDMPSSICAAYLSHTPRVISVRIMPGWNYLVRLYRPRPEVLSGAWTFPSPQVV